jgi:4-amino-4-deoxy-L-arabinose transferase-like glycosyltransferase
VVFVAAGVAGVVMRVWVYRTALGIPDSDEAVVGLMVRHFRHGELTTFFWAQAYGGSQEVLLTVPVFLVAGSSWLALRIVPMMLAAAAALVVWRVGRRTIGEPAAAIAGCVYWIWPPFVVYKLTHQWGFYASSVLYCGLLLLLALRLVERPNRIRAGVFGLVAGLSIWQSQQLVPVVLPLIGWTIWKQPRSLRQLWVAVPLAVVGALPWILWNIRHDWGSLHSTLANTTTYQHRLRIFVSPLTPMMLGLRTPFTQERLLPGAITLLLYAALAALFAYGAYRARSRDTSLLYVIAVAYPFIYALAPQTLFDQEPKYLVVLTPILILLLAQVATSYWRAVVVTAIACAISVVTLHRLETYFRTVPPYPPAAPRDLRPLISTLDELGVDRVYADFWVAYRLDFETNERIIASQNKFTHLTFVGGQAIASHHPYIRYRPYEREVESAPHHGFVFFRASLGRVHGIVAQLQQHGYRHLVVGPFVVYVLRK